MGTGPQVQQVSRAVITGASSGIGAAITRRLEQREIELICLSRRAPALAERNTQTPRARHIAVDLSDRSALQETLAALVADLAGGDDEVDLDFLVHAAGFGHFASLEELSAEQVAKVVEVNLIAPMLITRALIPSMKRSGAGHVVFVGSESALRGGRQGTAYCASKFGLRGFARSLRQEVSRAGLRVTSIHPGMVRTEFFDDLHFEPGDSATQALSADDVADMVMAAIDLPPGAVVDEIELSPLQHVVRKK